MLEKIDRKVARMHEALGQLEKEDLSGLETKDIDVPGSGFYREMDFSEGKSRAELANTASLLVANIARLKDHLKVWCEKNDKRFTGDNLINSNRDVAIVHDLWNTDKHAELDRPPRSGIHPRLEDLRQEMQLSTGSEEGSSVALEWNPRTGEMEKKVTGGGKAALVITADVVDDDGQKVGTLKEICERAAREWEAALTEAGVPIE